VAVVADRVWLKLRDFVSLEITDHYKPEPFLPMEILENTERQHRAGPASFRSSGVRPGLTVMGFYSQHRVFRPNA
jgi:hypothetical protein